MREGKLTKLDGERKLTTTRQIAERCDNDCHVVQLPRQGRELDLERSMEMLRLVVERVTAVVHSVTHLRDNLLEKQAPRVLRVEHGGSHNL